MAADAPDLAAQLAQLAASLGAAQQNLEAVKAERDSLYAQVNDPKLQAALTQCLDLATALAATIPPPPVLSPAPPAVAPAPASAP